MVFPEIVLPEEPYRLMPLSLSLMVFPEIVFPEEPWMDMPNTKLWMFVFWIVTLFTSAKWNPLLLPEP